MMSSRYAVSALLAATVALSGCGAQQAPQTSAAPATATPHAAATPAAAVSITDPWVKAAEKGMTGVFGTLVNPTAAEVTVVSGSSPLARSVELHEVDNSGGSPAMRPKEGGFVIPANGTHELRPGGDHIMLMGLTEAVKPGAHVPITLTLADGGSIRITAIAKDVAGGEENYEPDMDHGADHETDGHD